MGRRRTGDVVRGIREAVRWGRFKMSTHATFEGLEDDLDEIDIAEVLLRGIVRERQTGDPRGPKVRFLGRLPGGGMAEVVGRLSGDWVYVITVFRV